MIKKVLYSVIIIILQCPAIAAQQDAALNKDSLWDVIKNRQLNDTARINAGNELRMIYDEENPDSSLLVAKKMLEIAKNTKYQKWKGTALYSMGFACVGLEKYRDAIEYYKQAMVIYEAIDKKPALAKCYGNTGLAHLRLGEYDNAFANYTKAKQLYMIVKDTTKVGRTLNQLALIRDYQGRWIESLDIYYEALKMFEDTKDTYGQSVILINIASIYEQLKDEKKSVEILNRALLLKKEVGDDIGEGIILSMLAGTWSENGDHKKALEYLNKALTIFEKAGDKGKISKLYSSIGRVYVDKKDYAKAITFFKQGISIQKELELKTELGTTLSAFGEALIGTRQYKDAILACEEGLNVAKETGNRDAQKANCKCLAGAYEKNGDPQKALQYYKEYSSIKDSLITDENTREATRKEMSFGFAKKQLRDSLEHQQQQQIKDLKLSEQEATIKSEKAQKIALYVGLVLLFIIGAISYRSYRIKKKDNELIAAQKKEVELQKSEIENQKDLIEEQKHIVEEKQKEIIDSINYARRIQYTLLAHKETLQANLKEHFVLFKPKDIVSGDFYWATEHGNRFYIAVCDSTGHGVPGAFMSLLNIGFLSEAIKEKNITEPHLVLNYVRARLIDTISKDEQKDGMDGILLCIDKSTVDSKITYAAANNEPILIQNNAIVELDKDKMPVGKGEKTESFTLHTVQAQRGDVLYLYTDGYADQFGGPKGKKFKYKPLNELLLSVHQAEAEQQRQLINARFEEWKGHLEQVDDICLIGIRL